MEPYEVFRDQHGRACITIRRANRFDTLLIESPEFAVEVRTRCRTEESGPSEIQSAIDALVNHALSAPQQNVNLRVGGDGERIVLDLARDDGQVIVVSADGWAIQKSTEVKFRRPRGMLPLPLPSRDYSDLRTELASGLGLTQSEACLLFQAYLIGALREDIPYPLLEIVGPQGSTKSTTTKALRKSIDPHSVPVRRCPRTERDLFIAAENNRLLCLENLSFLADWQSDALCCISTGAGFATRKLYTDDAEALFNVRRPVIVNGIHPVVQRPDLRDRTLTVQMPAIPQEARKTEKEVWDGFDARRSRILGAVLQCASTALFLGDSVCPSKLPRMADWYCFVLAATEDPAFGFSAAEFERAYAANRSESSEISLDTSLIGRPLLGFVHRDGRWRGTASGLLTALTERQYSNGQLPPREWPSTPQALRNAIDRIAPNLRDAGLIIRTGRENDRSRERFIELYFAATGG
jgi:hypothetical protein